MLTEGRRRQLRVLLAGVLDASMIAAAFSLAYLLRFSWEVIPALDEPPAGPYFAVLPPLLPVWLLLFAAYGLYRERIQPFLEEALRVASAVSVGMMALVAGSFFYRGFSYSRLWMLLAWGLSLVLVLGARGLVRIALRAARRRGIDVHPVLIVGTGAEGRTVARTLREHLAVGYRPIGFLGERAGALVDGLPVLGGPRDVLRAIRQVGAQRVIVALPPEAREEAMHVAALCQEAAVPFAVVPDLYTLAATGAAVEVVGRVPMLTLQGSPLAGWGHRLKDALDLVGALAGLVLTLPLLVAIALAIVLDAPGPIFYRHRRIGKGGVPFLAWKFRTMIPGADARLVEDEALRARFARAHKLVDDPRVTRVGRWLRRTSLDELPQLLNVLKGEMSLVGPRPITEDELARYGPWERRLLCVKPGLTGLWQVLRPHEPDYAQRVRLDMYYIDHWSLGLDLQILARTLPSVIAGRGAY
jgi:exopolysaccharide biosynthesis polyprenyl glycosylphosphotransferase